MAYIKMFCALPQKTGVTAQYFHDHWRHPHGSLGLEISTNLHYVQTHRIDSAVLPDSQSRYEGVVEVWFADVDAAAGLPDDPLYQRYLVPDEPNFIDMDGIRFLFTDEEVLDPGPALPHHRAEDLFWKEPERATSIKLLQLVEIDGALPWAQEKDIHLGRQIGAFRHTRCHVNSDLHPDGCSFIGVRELWWPTVTAFEEGVERCPQAFHELLDRPRVAATLLGTAERFR
ncbi:MAG: hypothetical protein JWO15_2597 [Sphingomonadales bacterium]|nr:hypothetical protein [Sphingomonadales bacterium]